MTSRHVAVIGGGIAGLAAAHALATAADAPQVTVYEAGDRYGGKLHSSPFAGHASIDEGPDAFLTRVPHATALARRIGLGEQLVSPRAGAAFIYWDGLHDIPAGLMLGVPTGVRTLARSRLLSWRGKARAALEPLVPRTSTEPDSIGRYVRARFGNEVHERLVDPLVGSIYATDTDHFSLAAVPQLAALANGTRSVMLRRRAPERSAPSGPVFYAPEGGMSALVEALVADLRARGVALHLATPTTAIVADGARWRVERGAAHSSGTGDAIGDGPVDAVVLATPATTAARLARGIDDAAADGLGTIRAADVAMVTIALGRDEWPERLRGRSGYLVPKPMQRLVTAASFGSQKWEHWDDGAQVVLRVSLGRDGLPVLHLDDDRLIDATLTEVGRHLSIDLAPRALRVSRWQGAFAQYRPHHARHVAELEARLPATVALAGASYHGIGIPACIASAQRAAQSVLSALDR